MTTKSFPNVIDNDTSVATRRGSMGVRWILVLALLLVIGWAWPYAPESIPDRISDENWTLGWASAIVLLGAATGRMLRSRWLFLLVPLLLYAGGAVRWFQYDHGWTEPEWSPFLTGSGIAVAALFLVGGTAAAVASQVIPPEERPSNGIRLPAAAAALLGLLALTLFVLMPIPYLGALLGFAAVLAGVGVWQERSTNGWERLLAFGGLGAGSATVIMQIYELWGLVSFLL